MSAAKTPTILVVDDNDLNVSVLTAMLTNAGYRTLLAGDGRQCCQVAREKAPDLVLLDIMMPEMDGFEACMVLKGDTVTAEIPIIFISAMTDVKSKVQGLELGAVDYITKPFQRLEVLARVRLHLKLAMAGQALLENHRQKFQQLRDAQQSILTSPDDLPEAKFAVRYIPAQEAGGDFYDVLSTGEDLFGYFVADVSGHDVGTALMTPAIKVLLAEHASPVYTPAETMGHINGVLSSFMTDGNHVTACYAMLNRSTRQLHVVNAAHPSIVYVDKDGNGELIEASGDVLGAFEKAYFEPVKIGVQPGERFFLYSDGLIEDFGSQKQSRDVGVQKLIAACTESRGLDIESAVDQICSTLLGDEASLADDVIVLGVEV